MGPVGRKAVDEALFHAAMRRGLLVKCTQDVVIVGVEFARHKAQLSYVCGKHVW